MPWMMLVAKKYIAQTFSGKISVVVDDWADYNLPDVSDFWTIQSDYFRVVDIYINAEELISK